jgi:ABC-2 type transport system ATP-binding protein
MAAVLSCKDLRRRYGDHVAVDGVTFKIDAGETYGLLGPNGAGKTTTISMIAGILANNGGEILVTGSPMTPNTIGLKGAIGFVPQDIAIYPDLTGRENLVFFAQLYGLSIGDSRRRADEVLEVIGLSDRAKDLTKQYSGGMKRRLNIGVGLLHQPKLLILDEPTVGVDPQSRNAILESVAKLSESGMAVLYTTHYMEEAQRLCDRIGIIDHGKLIAEGTSRELVALIGSQDTVRLTISSGQDAALDQLKRLDFVQKADVSDEKVNLQVTDARGHLPEILQVVAAAGGGVKSVDVVEPDLEAVFLHLTGRALRD